MKIEVLKDARVKDFIKYCRAHRKEIDDSFLYDADLEGFKHSNEYPTCIATGDNDEIVGAASLIVDDYNRRGKKGRFRILHSEIDNTEIYLKMMQIIFKYTAGLEKLFVFAPTYNTSLIKIFEQIGFKVDRYSFILVKEITELLELNMPDDYTIRSLRTGLDEETWCMVRNRGFAKLRGSETPLTPEMVVRMVSSEDNIEGGSMILYHKDRPVGVVRGDSDEYDGSPIMNIGPLALIPEYQGKGLGRVLLRAALNFAREQSYNRAILCVNAENNRAKALYIKEGFKQAEGAICYRYDLVSK